MASANWVMFQWGPIQFQVFPMNVDNYSHHTGADWAKKEIAGAAQYREWVGESDEQIVLKGKIFPHFFARKQRERNQNMRVVGHGAMRDSSTGMLQQFSPGGEPSSGGMYHLDVLDNMRRLGQAHILIRGDGWHYGWFIMETMNRGHSFLAADGVGQQVEFEAQFQRVPIPNDGAEGITQMWASNAISSGAGGGSETVTTVSSATNPPQQIVRNVGPDGQPLDISDEEARRRLLEAGVGR